MSEQVLKNTNAVQRTRTRTITQVAMLGAVAGVLMNFEFPIPFLAPSFYQLDFSEIPVLIGSFAMGPLAGVMIELGEDPGPPGDKGNDHRRCRRSGKLLIWMCLCDPGRIDLYRFHYVKSRKHAVVGMAVGTVLTTILACFMNAFVLLPAYGKAFGMPIESFIEMGAAVHSSVDGMLGFVAMIIVPF